MQDDGEECDNGSGNSATAVDACRPTCALAFCGDGIVDDGEVCDPGLGEAIEAVRCQERCYADAGLGGAGSGPGAGAGVRRCPSGTR